jgi:hypothetical protein
LAVLFLGYGETSQHGSECIAESELPTSWWPGSRESKRGRIQRKGIPFKSIPSGGLLPPIIPYLIIFHSAVNS